jgi:putative ABC transport system substrate-binding protein
MVRTGLPFMGPHNGFVKAGALVALTADYTDNGRQAAELSIRILHGANAGNIAVATPRRVEMALNLQVANHIGLRISEEIIDEASQIFD